MRTAKNTISHHTSHTLDNGVSSSDNGIHGDRAYTIHTFEEGVSARNKVGDRDKEASNENVHDQGGDFETSFPRHTTDLVDLTVNDTLCGPAGFDEVAVTEANSPCSYSCNISRESDNSNWVPVTKASSTCSSGNLSDFSIVDSTLREGEQFATAFFDTAQKLEIAKALDDFGVDYIELTSPAASEQSRLDCESVCKLGLKAKILCHIRCNMDDARVAVKTGVDGINMCIGTSSHLMKHSHGKNIGYITAKAKEVIEYIKSNQMEIRFSGEDSFRSDFAEILKLYSFVDQLGITRVGIADTVGGATPREVFTKIDHLRKVVGCDIETHFHNDTGCAIANAYAALEAGATHIDTSVLGIGERNGITPLGGLLASLMPKGHKYIQSKYRIEKLKDLENLVAQIVGIEIPFNNFLISL